MSAIVETPNSSSEQVEANKVDSKTLDDEIPLFLPALISKFDPNDSVTISDGLDVHRTTAALVSSNNDEISESRTTCAAPTLVLLKAREEYNEQQYQLQLQQPQQPQQPQQQLGSDVAAAQKNELRQRCYCEKNLSESDDVSRTESHRSGTSSTGTSREDTLASQRLKKRERYANMTPEQRMAHNAKRRELYHRHSEILRQKRRERYQRLKPEDLEAKNRRRRERTSSTGTSRDDTLASRRLKDRERYASMTPEQKMVYNAKRRERYSQSEISRQKRRERYQLRERYLKPEDLEAKNRRRRERAALARQLKEAQMANGSEGSDTTVKVKKRLKTNPKQTASSDVASQNESMLPLSTSPSDILLPTTPMVTMLTADNSNVQSFEPTPNVTPAPGATSNPSPTTATDMNPIHVNNSNASATFTTDNIISSNTS